MKHENWSVAKLEEIQKIARGIRSYSLASTSRANSSHVGSCLSVADILAVLYSNKELVRGIKDQALNRNRIILSKGHAAAALYGALIESEILENPNDFLADNSELIGHASHRVKGVEFSTGSLGHGFPIATGTAFAYKNLNYKAKIFCIISDGECNEGTTWESALIASQLKLDNLILIIDFNKIQSYGSNTEILDIEPLGAKWESFGWNVKRIDGHDFLELNHAIFPDGNEKRELDSPTVIICDTIKGKGVSFMEGELKWHYSSANPQELRDALSQVENRHEK
jgi:transketolase